MQMVCYQQWNKPRLLAKDHGTREHGTAPAPAAGGLHKQTSSSAPHGSTYKDCSCKRHSQGRVLLGTEAGALSKASSRLPTSSTAQAGQVLVACCTSVSLCALALKKRAATNSVKTKLLYVSARDGALWNGVLWNVEYLYLCYSQLVSWKFSISF